MTRHLLLLVLAAASYCAARPARADEGMWTFDPRAESDRYRRARRAPRGRAALRDANCGRARRARGDHAAGSRRDARARRPCREGTPARDAHEPRATLRRSVKESLQPFEVRD